METWLILSSIEVIGLVFLFAQLLKKIKTTRFRVALGWLLFAGGLCFKLVLYGVEMLYEVEMI